MVTTDTSALIGRAKRGEYAALNTLYSIYAPAILHYCCQRLNDDNHAAHCVELVFVHAWDDIDSFEYRSDSLFMAWLYTIANQILREQARVNSRFARSLWPIANKRSLSVFDADLAARPQLLTQALNQLPIDQQQVITLRFFAGLSNTEIAAVINKSEGAVKLLQLRAIDRLHRLTT